jgi:hypothetical protein
MMGVAHGKGMWVVVGTETEFDTSPRDMGAVWTSPDGRRWNRVPHDPQAFSAEGSVTISDVAWGDGQWVAVGDVLPEQPNLQQPAVWVSTDGMTWTRVSSSSLNGEGRMNSVAWSGGTWIATGWVSDLGRIALWSSHDARTWTLLSDSPTTSGEDSWNEAVAIATTGDQWLLIGQVEYSAGIQEVWTSRDGKRWRRGPDFMTKGDALDADIDDVTWADGYWLAVGRAVDDQKVNPDDEAGNINGGVWTSTDAATWHRIQHSALGGTAGQILRSVTWSDGRGIAVGSEGEIKPGEGASAAVWHMEGPACG